jgi:hypothetical protein
VTKVEVYTSKQDVDTLEIVDANRPDLDFLHVVNIEGLDPVTASVSSTALPFTDVGVISGEEVPARNIVLTVSPDPDWSTFKPEELRVILYQYFTPKSTVKLVFTTEELTYPVEIYGEVEACEYNQYSEGATYQISIICPDPYFTSTHEETVTGTAISFDSWPPDPEAPIVIDSQIPIGFRVTLADGYETGELYIQVGDPSVSTFHMSVVENPNPNTFEMDSRSLHKKARTIAVDTGIFTNLLGKIESGYQSIWPILQPGSNIFAVMGDVAGNDWVVKYFNRYTGL